MIIVFVDRVVGLIGLIWLFDIVIIVVFWFVIWLVIVSCLIVLSDGKVLLWNLKLWMFRRLVLLILLVVWWFRVKGNCLVEILYLLLVMWIRVLLLFVIIILIFDVFVLIEFLISFLIVDVGCLIILFVVMWLMVVLFNWWIMGKFVGILWLIMVMILGVV